MTGARPTSKPRIRVELAGPSGADARVFLDEVELPGVRHVNVSIGVGAVHLVTVVFVSPEVEVIHVPREP